MQFLRSALCLFLGLASVSLNAQNTTQSPDDFLPHHIGEQFTPHHLLVDYFQYLASQSPQTMRLEPYGATNESRPLVVAMFSSPQNLARLEAIRLNNLRLAGVVDGAPDRSAAPVAIVWLSMSVHGNEPSGSECSMELAYKLATQSDADVRRWLENTVVILDPSVNPDGYDRYTHWYRSAANLVPNADPEAREHREPWPAGRSNHYYYDLNRDWAWATQVETSQRLRVYQRWLPHIHADVHEQYIDNPYYFAPAAEPMHDFITPWQREFQTTIGENHARYFDANGWLYFTREVFDLFYPSYGDTYPMFNGAIGMTYEQAGHSTAGRAIRTGNGDTLTLRDRIDHHLTTSLSTIEAGSKSAAAVVSNFNEYYSRSASNPPGVYKTFVVRESNDPNQVNRLCAFLDQHNIRYGRAGAERAGIKAFDYHSGKEISTTVKSGDLIVSAYQPHGILIQVLFEPESRLTDSLTYDITAWAIPHAYGLDAVALKERLDPKKTFEPYKAPVLKLAAHPYAWCIHRRSLNESAFLGELLLKGVKVRTSSRSFALSDQQFAPGTLVITRADNRAIDGRLDSLVQLAALENNVSAHPIFSGWAGKGSDLGSEAFRLLETPKVALVYGDDVDENSYGHTWYFFEREIGYPVSPVPLDKIAKVNLNKYNTIVFANGNYNLSEEDLQMLQDWMRTGGRIIAFENAVKIFADKEGFDLKSRPSEDKDSLDVKPSPKPYLAREREGLSDALPGAVVRCKLDNTHPLGYGMGEQYHSLKTQTTAFEIPENATTAVWLEAGYHKYGFIGSKAKKKLDNTTVASVQKIGSGTLVYFVDNPLFRSFWHQGKLLFANALFY